MHMWQIRAVLSVLQQAVVFVVVVFGILAYARTCCMQCVTGIFYSVPIIPGSQQIIPTSIAYSSIRTKILQVTDCCVPYTADRF